MKNGFRPRRLAGCGLGALITLVLIGWLLPSNLSAAERLTLSDKDSGDTSTSQSTLSIQTDDGGRLLVNTVRSGKGDKDISLTKTDKDGKVSWIKTYANSGDEVARSIQQTADDGFIVTGYTDSQGSGGRDLYLLRLSKTGERLWEAATGNSGDDEGIMAQQLTGGDFVAVGYSLKGDTVPGIGVTTQKADIIAVRYDRNGKKIWQKYYGGDGDDYACSLQTVKSGGLVIAGCTRSFSDGTWDIYVLKISDSGAVTWERSIGGTLNYIGTGIQPTPDNGYLVLGYSYQSSMSGRRDMQVRLDSNGGLLGQQTLDDAGLYGDAMQSKLTAADGSTTDTESTDNTSPPPEMPQAKQSRQSGNNE